MDGMWDTVKQNTSQYEGLQTRHDKLREELLGLLSTEADKRQDSIAVVRNSLTTGLNEQRTDLKALRDSTEVLTCPATDIFLFSAFITLSLHSWLIGLALGCKLCKILYSWASFRSEIYRCTEFRISPMVSPTDQAYGCSTGRVFCFVSIAYFGC